jgi:hypothetical protein
VKTNRYARKGYDSSFTDIKYLAIFKAPVLHRINVGLQKLAVMNVINITIYFKVISKQDILRNLIKDIINEYVTKQGP